MMLSIRLLTLLTFFTLLFGSLPLMAADLIDLKNRTIKDKATGLIWQKGEQEKMRWEIADQFCQKLSLGGYKNWRLPSKQELMTLVERNMFNPCINRNFFPKAQPDNYWSSSKGTASVGSAAWMINFGYGEARFFNKYNKNLVRCVRNDQ